MLNTSCSCGCTTCALNSVLPIIATPELPSVPLPLLVCLGSELPAVAPWGWQLCACRSLPPVPDTQTQVVLRPRSCNLLVASDYAPPLCTPMPGVPQPPRSSHLTWECNGAVWGLSRPGKLTDAGATQDLQQKRTHTGACPTKAKGGLRPVQGSFYHREHCW